MSNSFPIRINGTDYRARRTIIERTHFGVSDHGGVMTIELGLSYPDGGAGMTHFGGYTLDATNPDGGDRLPTAYGMDFAARVMSAAGVTKWEDVQGSECLTLFAAAGNPADKESFWALAPLGLVSVIHNKGPFIPEEHAALWAETPAPALELGEEITTSEQITALHAGSILSFTALNRTTGVAIRKENGWSVTGVGSGTLADFPLWARVTAVAYRGSASSSARGNALKYDQLEGLATGVSVLLGRENIPGAGLRNRDGSWSVTGMSTLLSDEELWELFSPISILPSGPDSEGRDF